MTRAFNLPSPFKHLHRGLTKIANATQNPTILELVAECLNQLEAAANEYHSLILSDYLTTRQAADKLELTVSRLAQLAKRGDLGAVRKGSSWLFPAIEIERYKASVAGKDLHDPTRGD